jgi:hypothetical protein
MFGSYWAKLTDPIPMDTDKQRALSSFIASQNGATAEGWTDLVQQLRDNDRLIVGAAGKQLYLL